MVFLERWELGHRAKFQVIFDSMHSATAARRARDLKFLMISVREQEKTPLSRVGVMCRAHVSHLMNRRG
jgi:hypothetical protein